MKNNSMLRSLALCCLCAAALAFTGAAHAGAPDTSTPKKAALAFANALESGDIAAAKTLANGTDAEWAMIKTLSNVLVAGKAFSDAAHEKFGPDAKLPPSMVMDLSALFDASEEKINGDTATLITKENPNDPNPPTLKKTDKGWIMDLSNLDKAPPSADDSKMLDAMAKSFNAVATDIKAGKYKTLDEAMAAYQSQMESLRASHGAATSGSSNPAGPAPGQ